MIRGRAVTDPRHELRPHVRRTRCRIAQDDAVLAMFASRSIFHDGWKANCPVPGPSFRGGGRAGPEVRAGVDPEMLENSTRRCWELYHVAVDPAETRNLAADEPGRLAEMRALWYEQAEEYGVFPLAPGRPGTAVDRATHHRPAP